MRALWVIVGIVSVGLGMAGIVLPLVPTTPFMLLAAFAFARSSPRLYNALLSHPQFGPIITNWRRDGSIDRRSKILAIAVMAACICISLYMRVPASIMVIQVVILAAVATFILTRPTAPRA